ncbi:MAG: hypothetical protein MUC50_23670 [Myxococcota bacterium]|nr:hypothetical protein [Myxococcota bacterium]
MCEIPPNSGETMHNTGLVPFEDVPKDATIECSADGRSLDYETKLSVINGGMLCGDKFVTETYGYSRFEGDLPPEGWPCEITDTDPPEDDTETGR